MWQKVQLLTVACIAAPIVEETMFRGVLYRHLRQSTRGIGTAASIAISILIMSFVFAAIHPQGLVAIPVLMSLAIAFALAREWRGSLVPSMVMHAVNNGLAMTVLIMVFSS